MELVYGIIAGLVCIVLLGLVVFWQDIVQWWTALMLDD